MKKTNKTKYQFTILRPGGNDQMLIKGLVPKSKRRWINDEMIKRFPSVEQVSFYEFDRINNFATLELAGGEFCGNATRSLAYLLLKGKKGELSIKVSGTKRKLKAGIRKQNSAFAQMPVSKFNSIRKLNTNLFRVDLEGITQLVYIQNRKINPKRLKKYAFEILKKENLIYSVPAAGVMFIKEQRKFIDLQPVVWVRDIETLLYETACASGTAAVGLWNAIQSTDKVTSVKVKQPSNEYIQARVIKNGKQFINIIIEGPVKVLKSKGELSL